MPSPRTTDPAPLPLGRPGRAETFVTRGRRGERSASCAGRHAGGGHASGLCTTAVDVPFHEGLPVAPGHLEACAAAAAPLTGAGRPLTPARIRGHAEFAARPINDSCHAHDGQPCESHRPERLNRSVPHGSGSVCGAQGRHGSMAGEVVLRPVQIALDAAVAARSDRDAELRPTATPCPHQRIVDLFPRFISLQSGEQFCSVQMVLPFWL